MKQTSKILHEAWCYIGGGIEEGEKAWESAFREIEEETGINSLSLYSANICEQFYGIKEEFIYIAPGFVGIVAKTEEVILNEEHMDFRWLSFENAREKASLPGNDKILEHIEKHFVKRIPPDILKVWGNDI